MNNKPTQGEAVAAEHVYLLHLSSGGPNATIRGSAKHHFQVQVLRWFVVRRTASDAQVVTMSHFDTAAGTALVSVERQILMCGSCLRADVPPFLLEIPESRTTANDWLQSAAS